MDREKKCTECGGALHRSNEPPDYDPGDSEICWDCDLAAYGEPD